MKFKKLSKKLFLKTMGSSMNRITDDSKLPLDIWLYIDNIPEKNLILESDLRVKKVYSIYMNDSKTYEHVLINTKRDNNYFVIVIDVSNETIYGYYLLDLNKEYGLS